MVKNNLEKLTITIDVILIIIYQLLTNIFAGKWLGPCAMNFKLNYILKLYDFENEGGSSSPFDLDCGWFQPIFPLIVFFLDMIMATSVLDKLFPIHLVLPSWTCQNQQMFHYFFLILMLGMNSFLNHSCFVVIFSFVYETKMLQTTKNQTKPLIYWWKEYHFKTYLMGQYIILFFFL